MRCGRLVALARTGARRAGAKVAVLGIVLLAGSALGGSALGGSALGGSSGRTAVAVADARAETATPLLVPAGTLRLPELGTAVVASTDDVGDPFVLPVPRGVPGDPRARYVLLWTTDWRAHVPVAVSADLRHWRRLPDALPHLPAWATPSRAMTWAPSALPVPGGWVLYYTTQERASGQQCIGAAFSSSPVGPYRDRSAAPLVCQHEGGGSIDPSVAREPSGAVSLVWKNDGNATGVATSIWQQQLSADGRSVTGGPHLLLTARQPWQRGIVEGPAVLPASAGGWWLFFSGGAWQSADYVTGVAWCVSLQGPCREAADGPLIASRPGAVSPGGLDTFVDAAGATWAAYSAFQHAPSGAAAGMAENRVLEIAPVLGH